MKNRIIILLITTHLALITSLSAQNRRSSTTTPSTSTTKSTSTLDKKTSSKASPAPTKLAAESAEASVSASKNNSSNLTKLGLQIELGVLPVQSLNSETINAYKGSLGLNYNLLSNFYIGLFGQTLLYHQNIDVANIDNKIMDLSSIEYNSAGLRFLNKIPIGKFSITPQLDASYNFFISKAIDFGQDKKAFLDYRYLSLTPKLNLGFNITESTMMGLFGGYNMQLMAIKGQKLEEFNPTGVLVGLVVQVRIIK